MSGPSIGDLPNAKGITWGWFYGDWTPIGIDQGKAICTSGYDPHYAPFQYYASTANPHHLPPTSISMIGHTDRANHQYSISDFWAAAANGNMPAVTFLKAPHNMNGHPATSSPLAEQTFLVDTINQLQQTSAVAADGHPSHLGRFRRLVRPRHAAHRQPVQRPGQRCPARSGTLR